MRTLVASLLAACLLALLAFPAQAGKNNGSGRVQHGDLQIQKYFDKATPKSDGTKGAVVKGGWNVVQNKNVAKTTDTSTTGQKYMTIKMNDANVSGYSR